MNYNLKYNDLFWDAELTKPLTEEELYDCFQKYKLGNMEARSKIITHSIRIVRYEIKKNFNNTPYDKNDLMSIGIIGLIKSVDTFDPTKNIKFLTYATRVIDNEIGMFMRKEKKHTNVDSIEKTVVTDKNGSDTKLKDLLIDTSSDFTLNYEEAEVILTIIEIINQLPERDREIILLQFGLKNNKPLTQAEIAKQMNLSQSYISRISKKILEKIKIKVKQLENTPKSYKPQEKKKALKIN